MAQLLDIARVLKTWPAEKLAQFVQTTIGSGQMTVEEWTAFERGVKLELYQADPLLFATKVFPHHFSLVPASIHHQMVRLLFGVSRDERSVGEGQGSGSLAVPVKSSLPVSPSEIPQQQSHNSVPQTLNQPLPSTSPSTPQGKTVAPSLTPTLSGRKVALAAPRGFAKSTLASFLLPLWAVYLNQRHFILIVSNTHAQAVKFLQAIKHEVETNAVLKQLVPQMTMRKDKWAEDDVELSCGTERYRIVALGQGAQLRGLKFLQHRPDLILIDDGEDDEMVRSDLRRANYQWWLDHVVLPTNPRAWVLMIGTVLHEASLLNRILRQVDPADRLMYADWETACFQALLEEHTPQEHSAWPAHQPTEQLQLERSRDPYGFSQEKQNQPVDPSYCPFKSEFFTERRFWGQLPRDLHISLTIDPAWTVKDHSKETAVIAAGWDSQHRLWVLDLHHAKYDDPSLIEDLLLDWYLRWTKNEQVNPGQKFLYVGFDAISAQKMLLMSFRRRCQQRNLHPVTRELKADRDKMRRIWQLEPLFRQDRIFLRPDMSYLQAQLQGFPRNVQGGLVDCADALAYHLQFEPFSPQASAEDPTDEDLMRPQPLTLQEYVQCHEDTREYLRRFPEHSGQMDARLLASLIRN